MPSARKRMRRSFGGRWTDQERFRLWDLRNSHRMLPWELFRANYFPNRSIYALQKQYSEVKQSLQLVNAMDLGDLSNGNNNPSRTSTRLGKRTTADNEPAAGEPRSKQTRISEPDTEYSPPESEDSSSSDDDGDLQPDGSLAPRRTPRKQPTDPSRPGLVTLSLAQRERPNSLAIAATADQQPGVPSTSATNPVAPPQPPRTSTPHVEEQPAIMQSPTQPMGENSEPERDEGARSTSPCTKKTVLDHIGGSFREVCKFIEEAKRAQRRAELQVEQIKKELRSEKEQVFHLKDRLELKDTETDHLKELVEKKEVERNHLKELFEQRKIETKVQIERLTAELQDQKARIDQMSRHIPCPGCIEKEQQVDQLLGIWRGQRPLATPTPEATVPGSGLL
ncbi:hypothetical protein BJX96DRAFT_148566 [Aspergillus floccosus]